MRIQKYYPDANTHEEIEKKKEFLNINKVRVQIV
jgi:hypothetical protein